MRLHVVSDLHVDVAPITLSLATGAHVLVVAGDVCGGIGRGMAYLRSEVPAPTPIVMVAGNHEFYGQGLEDELAAAPGLAAAHDVHFLENQAVTLAGVRFLGATLWTDFSFGGDAAHNMRTALLTLNDYRHILMNRRDGTVIIPGVTRARHVKSVAWLDARLTEPFDGPTVVVTHHAPHPGSIAPRFVGNPVNCAFVTDLEWLILKHQPALWIHGHMHTSFDYAVGRTRVLANPRGYRTENRSFDHALTVDLR